MQLSRIYWGTNQQKAKGSSIDPPAVEKLLRIQKKSWSIYLSVEKLSRLLKNSFSRKEKHIYEYNQACNSTKDSNNILSSQNHLSTTILST